MTVRVVGAPWVLTGESRGPSGSSPLSPRTAGGQGRGEGGAIRDGAIALDGDTIVAVGPRAEVEALHGKGERRDGVILPAVVNAHLHLELSHLAGSVSGGEGLPAWIELFLSARARARDRDPGPAMTMAAEDLVRYGVAAVGDVSNTLASIAPLGQAGIAGTVFHEVFGLTPLRMLEALEAAKALQAAAPRPSPGLRVVTSPHAIYSTHHPSLVELLRAGPGSIHLAEDPAERAFCSTGTGGFGHLVARMGGRARDLVPKGRSAIAVVAPHLAPHHLVVHCVDVDEDDLALLRASGATAVLCPRSNDFISGRLPRLDALLAAGIPLAIGTDSLASCPSLAPLADVAVLRRAFPSIPASRILPLAWNGAAVGAPHVGALVPGRAPGVLAAPARVSRIEDPFELVVAFGAEEKPFEWLARQRPPSPRPSPPAGAGGEGGLPGAPARDPAAAGAAPTGRSSE
jgi:cytosine/adenosine deaminase-related metal-dependent hydrolase